MALTSVIFLVAFAVGLGLCLARGPIWGLYTYVGVFYLHPPSRWWGVYLPDLRWSLFAAFITLICVFLWKRDDSRKPFFSYGLSWIFLLYVMWMWIQLPFVISEEHLAGTVLFTKYLILLYLIYEIVGTKEQVRGFLFAHVLGCFYLGWLAFVALDSGRLEGVGGPGIDDSNTMSMHLGTGVIVGAMLLMTEKRWRFWAIVAMLPFIVNGMIQGNSRGAFVGLVAGGLCLFWLKPPAFRKQFIAFGVLGTILFAYLANDFFIQRMLSLEAVTNDSMELDFSARSRLAVLAAEWQMFLDHPLGVGHAGTAALSTEYLAPEYLTIDAQGQAGRSSHNTFMSVVVDQGVPGIILLFALLIWAWRHIREVTRRSLRPPDLWGYGSAVSAALVVAVVAGQFAPYLKAEVQYWLLAMLMSLHSLRVEEQVPLQGEHVQQVTPPAQASAAKMFGRNARRGASLGHPHS